LEATHFHEQHSHAEKDPLIAVDFGLDWLMSETSESPAVLIMRNSPAIAGAFSRAKGFREIATEQKWIVAAALAAEPHGAL